MTMTSEFRPLEVWTGALTQAGLRRDSKFKAGYEETLDLLFREAGQLGAKHMVIQVDIAERQIRADGLPYARARFGLHPGVVVSFDSRFGPLRYATDTFTEWQANLRAVALSLEALRKVDRYGVSKRGEQYTGWKALPAQVTGFASAADAAAWMRAYARELGLNGAVEASPLGALYKAMAKRMHPDMGGARADWDRLDEARRALEASGQL